MTGVFEVGSVEETWALARRFASELRPGDVVCLEGDLGAGKTTFVQGLAAALGVAGRVTSPTFCLVQEHRGRSGEVEEWKSGEVGKWKSGEVGKWRSGEVEACAFQTAKASPATLPLFHPSTFPLFLVHMDLYRLRGEEDVLAVGWEDYLADGAILAVEWPDRAGSLIPATAKRVAFEHLDGEERRRITFGGAAEKKEEDGE